MFGRSLKITPEERANLIAFFGKEGSKVVLGHIDNLEATFGSGAEIIKLVMKGKISRE
ncbi:MAG: hypothetical protein ACYCQJ_03460 [Nitrososphaerales archaeon]